MSCRSALAIAVCVVFLAPFAAAQTTTPVRSGEHAEFTRLVFPARDGLDWSMVRPTPDRITLTFDDPGLEFDIATVFDRIPRSRLADLGASGPRLTLDLACACEVDVTQIRSGHIVMDIAAIPEDSVPAPMPLRPAGARLPLRLPPRSDLFVGFEPGLAGSVPPAEAVVAAALPGTRTETDPSPQGDQDRAAQISIRAIGRTALLPDETTARPEDPRLVCPEEVLTADFFRQDPAVAMERIPVLRAQLVDGADNPVSEAYRALAEAYLASGLGAEAAHVLRQASATPDPVLLGIAAALDGMPDLTEAPAPFDASCGPATAVLALLTGLTRSAWQSVDARAIATFLDTLPKAARDDLVPRIQPALVRLGRPDLLSLDPAPPPPPPRPVPVTAGTDSSAIRATIANLEEASGTDQEDALANGLALRGSVPDGPLRAELDHALAVALALTGHLTEAADVIDNRPDLASAVLAEAARTLPADELAVVAVRLRPALADGGPGSDLAVATLREFGLDGLAGGFGARPPTRDVAPRPEDEAEGGVDAWIAREFSQIAPETPRGQLAALRQARNEAAPPQSDFARAAAAAADSARLSDAVLSLISGTD